MEIVGDKDIHYEMPTVAAVVTCERQAPDRVPPKIIAHYPTERQEDTARHYEMPTVAEVVTYKRQASSDRVVLAPHKIIAHSPGSLSHQNDEGGWRRAGDQSQDRDDWR